MPELTSSTRDPARSPLATSAEATPFARLKVAQLALKVEAQRLSLDETKRRLVDVTEANAALDEIGSTMRDALMNWPARVSGLKVSRKYRFAAAALVSPRTRSSCGSRPCSVPKARSMRPRASGEYDGICRLPSCASARPTSVRFFLSTRPPASGVRKYCEPRSV